MSRDTREPLRSADLRDRISIVAPAGTAAATETEIDVGVPAGIFPLPLQFQAREYLAAGGVQGLTTYMVSVRYRTDIEPNYLLVEEGGLERRFQIISRVLSERRDALDMMCVTT